MLLISAFFKTRPTLATNDNKLLMNDKNSAIRGIGMMIYVVHLSIPYTLIKVTKAWSQQSIFRTKITTMKIFSLSLVILALIHLGSISAQIFTADTGPFSTTASDSRSVNFFDLDNDGFQEIYISNGASGGQADLLYRNVIGGVLLPISDMDIVNALNPSDGASFADYNNDGHVDAIVSSWYGREDLLYINNGNASLDYNESGGIASGSFAETAAFGDYDNDGWLDIYVTNSGGDGRNFLYKNSRDGSFERISNHPLVNDAKPSRAAIWGDFNDDGLLDLFVTNESNQRNDLFYGTGSGDFEKYTSGSIANSTRGSITASWGDIDNDGDLDLFVGNSGFFSGQKNQLFENTGTGFNEISNSVLSSESKCSFGSAFGDFDNDGDIDLAVANGFCNSAMANDLYENLGDGSFKKVSELLVSNDNTCSFGIAWGDINNDGSLELAVANCKNNSADIEHANTLMINKGNENNWLQVKLKGLISNTDAIGTKLFVKAQINGQSITQRRDISSQSGYAGQNSMVSHFGLADAEIVDSLIIHWPSGNIDRYADISINQILNLSERLTNNTSEAKLSSLIQFNLFPNPLSIQDSSIQLHIESKSKKAEANLFLSNSFGLKVYQKSIDLFKGTNRLDLTLKDLGISPGLYYLTIMHNNEMISKKVVVN